MKKIQEISWILLALFSFAGYSAGWAQTYDRLWKQVEQAQKKSLPQTVINLTDEIYRKAGKEKNAPQMLKAYLSREACRQSLTPDSLYATLKFMEQWAVAEENVVDKAIMHSLLAQQYAELMLRNSRMWSGNTLLDVDELPDDVRQWSASQYVVCIDAHCKAALQPVETLLETSTDRYVPFTLLQDGSRFYGHDLYHLLASRAIDAYGNLSSQGGGDSLKFARIAGIYEEMQKVYRSRPGMEDAVLFASLGYARWRLDNGLLDGEGYLSLLDSLMTEYGAREACAQAYIDKAGYLQRRAGAGVAEALRLCEEGVKRYPGYLCINELRNIRAALLLPQLNVNTRESGYPGDSLELNVHYRNLSGFTLNLYSTTLAEVPYLDSGINKDTYRRYARKISATHYALSPLPANGKSPEDLPYLPSDTLLKLPVPAETGVYILQVVPDAGTTDTADRFFVTTRFKVLTLNLGDGRTEVATLDARSGQPVADAVVSFYSVLNGKERKMLAEVTTDADGKGVVSWQTGIHSYVARKGKDTAMPPQSVYFSRENAASSYRMEKQLTLLTDRSIYRPGQTVYVKGVVFNQGRDTAYVLEGERYELALLDANYKEVSVQQVQTNDFGSFTTEFVLPEACLNGTFRVQPKNQGGGFATFRVEAYKRPAFEITFNPVADAYRLGDRVTLTGRVKAFSGAALQELPLAYTVTRRSPLRSYWNPSEKPLQADTVRIDSEGNFSIPLTLSAPDGEGRWMYSYSIEAVVTSEAGETQSATYSLMASDRKYSVDASLPDFICKEDTLRYTFRVTNAANVPQQVEGTWQLFRLPESGFLPSGSAPVLEGSFVANERQDCSAWNRLPSGSYQLTLSVPDDAASKEEERQTSFRFVLFSTSDKRPAAFSDLFYYAESEEFDAAHPASFLFGTSHEEAFVLVDVFCDRKRIDSRILQLSDTLLRMEYPYEARYGDGLTLLFNFVKNGQLYSRQVLLKKRQPERKLDMKWEVFRDRLRPGQEEEWKLIIKTPQGLPAAAELLATMYDASLDKIYSRSQVLKPFFPSFLYGAYRNASNYQYSNLSLYFPQKYWKVPAWGYDLFFSPAGWYGGGVFACVEDLAETQNVMVAGYTRTASAALVRSASPAARKMAVANHDGPVVEIAAIASDEAGAGTLEPAESLQPVEGLRTNFAETAFFYPQLRTNEQGEVAFSFVVPQSLTRWNFRAYSHTREMQTGQLDASVVTAKEFMLTPNMPRFVRVGDKTRIAGTVANLSEQPVKGTARLVLFDPETEKVLLTRKQKFSVEAGKNTAVEFDFEVSDRYPLLGVRMVADGGSFSDGEQHLLPVLSNKEFITETLPMPVRGGQIRSFALDSLFNGNSPTATDRRLTVEFTGNPAWYAVQALPSLGLPVSEDALAWATAFYANTLAGFVANSQPRIRSMVEAWKATGTSRETFLSQLQKNQEVKNILLAESPWMMEATTEADCRARLVTLFDLNLQNSRNLSTLAKLKELQGADGAWSWYPGMTGSRSVTSYITELLVRLPLLTHTALSSDAVTMKQKAFGYLHKQAQEEYRALLRAERQGAKVNTLSSSALDYLYLVALSDEQVPADYRKAYDYFMAKVPSCLTDGSPAVKAHAALVLQKAGRKAEAGEFIASLKEHLVQEEEVGAHFAFLDTPYNWGMMPVQTHVAVMEALRGADGNETLLEEMKLWLLKQKQASCWSSPVATADAVYALLCQGGNGLENRGDVRIALGRKVMETLAPESGAFPGLAYLKESFAQGSAELKARTITVEKRDEGVAWGAVYAQYLSPISDVKQQGGSLSIEKELYVERVAPDGTKSLQALSRAGRLAVGDKVVSRMTLRLDRAMDFVQLKDQRGACFEPTATLSGYRWSGGCGYYMEVEDAATNFFFDHLGKGVYVLEHSYRVARGGTYEAGLATVQSAYAPEFSAHTAGATVTVE